MSPELVQAASGATRWQQSFDAPLTDVFQVQADVAERVARELGVALAAGQRRHLEERPTGDLGAYDLYLKGRYAWHQRTAARTRPGAPPAGAGDRARPRLRARARRARRRLHGAAALERPPARPDLSSRQGRGARGAEARQHARGAVRRPRRHQRDVRVGLGGGRAELPPVARRSIPTTPTPTTGTTGDFCSTVGRTDEAVAEARRARELDPLSLRSTARSAGRSTRGTHGGGRGAAPRSGGHRQHVSSPTNGWGQPTSRRGRPRRRCRCSSAASTRQCGSRSPWRMLGYASREAGRREEAERCWRAAGAAAKGYVTPTSLAVLHAGLGDTAETFAWLRRAAESHGSVSDLQLRERSRHGAVPAGPARAGGAADDGTADGSLTPAALHAEHGAEQQHTDWAPVVEALRARAAVPS